MAEAGSSEKDKLHEDIARIKAALQSDEDGESGDESDVGSDNDGQGANADGGPMAGVYFGWSDAPNTVADSILEHQPGLLPSETQDDMEYEDLPTNAETCLAMNRAYQEIISENLHKVEMVLAHNKDKQTELSCEIEKSAESKQKDTTAGTYTTGHFAIPYFKDNDGMCPPPNDDVLMKRTSNDREPYPKPAKPINEEDRKKLTEAVKKDALKRLMQPLMNKREIEYQKLRESVSESEKAEIRIRIDNLSEDIAVTEVMPEKQLWQSHGRLEDSDKIDWLKISASDFDGQISAENLSRYWRTILHPDVNKGKWTPVEDQQLAELVYDHEETNWEEIAQELGTNRSSFMCLQRWKTKLDPKLQMIVRWTKEEDEMLRDLVDTLKSGTCIPWEEVSEQLEGRTVEQCLLRYDDLSKGGRPGKMTTEEDVKILIAVHCFGLKDWNNIASVIPGRSGDQCRERYTNSLAPSLKLGDWTYEEDKFLISAVKKYGKAWNKIVPLLPGRTDNMALQRYKRLLGWKEVADLSEELPNNFKNLIHPRKKAKSKKHNETQQTAKEMKKSADKKNKMGLVEESFELTPARRKAQEVYMEKMTKGVKTFKLLAQPKEEISAIQRDLAHGVYVPRPIFFHKSRVPGTTITKKGLIEHRHNLYRIVKERMKGVLYEGLEPQENLGKDIKNIIKTSRLNDSEVLKSKLSEMIQILAFEGKALAPAPGIRRHQERLDAAISQLLSGRNPRKTSKVGRPRTFMKHDELNAEDAQRTQRQILVGELDETASDIGAVMMKAMNVKFNETAKLAADQKLEIDNKKKEAPGYLKAFESVVHSDKHLALNPMASPFSAIINERKAAKEEEKVKYRHQPYTGEAGLKAYTMPPWPPNCTNMEAFKNLLLTRKRLIAQAGSLYTERRKDVRQPVEFPTHIGNIGQDYQSSNVIQGSSQSDSLTQVQGSAVSAIPDTQPPATVVPQQNMEGPLVIANQMNTPVEVVIKCEHCHSEQDQNNVPDERTDVISTTTPPDTSVSYNNVVVETAASCDENISSQVQSEPHPSSSQQSIFNGRHEGGELSQEDRFEGFISKNAMETSLDDKTVNVLSAEIRALGVDVDCLNSSVEKKLLKRFALADVRMLRELLGKYREQNEANSYAPSYTSDPSSSNSPQAEIAKLRNTHNYQQLKSRFESLFLWPAILSTLPIGDKETVETTKSTARNRRKHLPMTRVKTKRWRKVIPKEQKAQEQETRRQIYLKVVENKRLLEQGLITQEDLQKMTEAQNISEKVQPLERDTLPQTEENTGEPPKKKRGRPKGSRTVVHDNAPRRSSSRIAVKSVEESTNISNEEPPPKRRRSSIASCQDNKEGLGEGDTGQLPADSDQVMDVDAGGDQV